MWLVRGFYLSQRNYSSTDEVLRAWTFVSVSGDDGLHALGVHPCSKRWKTFITFYDKYK